MKILYFTASSSDLKKLTQEMITYGQLIKSRNGINIQYLYNNGTSWNDKSICKELESIFDYMSENKLEYLYICCNCKYKDLVYNQLQKKNSNNYSYKCIDIDSNEYQLMLSEQLK